MNQDDKPVNNLIYHNRSRFSSVFRDFIYIYLIIMYIDL